MGKEIQDSSGHMFLSALGLVDLARDTQSNRKNTTNIPAIIAYTEIINLKDLVKCSVNFDWKHLLLVYQTSTTEVVTLISSGKLRSGTSTSYKSRKLKKGFHFRDCVAVN